jgi:hypothetical protein
LFLAFALLSGLGSYFGESNSAQICGLVCSAKKCVPHRLV